MVLSMRVFLVVFGEHDDSPNAQFLGLLIAIAAGILCLKDLIEGVQAR